MRAQFSSFAILCLTLVAGVSATPTPAASDLLRRDGNAVSGNSGDANGAGVRVSSGGGEVINRHSNVASGGGLSRTGNAFGGNGNDDDDHDDEDDRNSDFISFAVKRSDGDARSGDTGTANGATVRVDGGGGGVRNFGSNRADGEGRSVSGDVRGGDNNDDGEDYFSFEGFKRDGDARSGDSGNANGAAVVVGSGGGRIVNVDSNRASGGGESISGNAQGGNDNDSEDDHERGRNTFFNDV